LRRGFGRGTLDRGRGDRSRCAGAGHHARAPGAPALARRRFVLRQAPRRDAQPVRRAPDQEGMSVAWVGVQDADALRAAAFERIVASSASALASRGRFAIVLAGGTTPRGVYAM